MTQVIHFKPENGVAVYGSSGYQNATTNATAFDWQSGVFDMSVSSRFQVDSCWETGNIWQISDGLLIKRKFDGDIIKSVSMFSPCVSVIQPRNVMPSNPDNFSQDDLGAWVINPEQNKLIKFDYNLEVILEISSITASSIVFADIDGGCYLFDDAALKVYKIDKNGNAIGDVDYSIISDQLLSSDDVVNVKIDQNGRLFIAFDSEISVLDVDNGSFDVLYTISPSDNLMLAGCVVTDIEIDRSVTPNNFYAVGSSSIQAWVAKWDRDGSLLDSENLTLEFPIALKISQFPLSNVMYILYNETLDTVQKLEKDTLTPVSSLSFNTDEGEGLTIYHNTNNDVTISHLIAFEIVGVKGGIPYIENNDYMIVTRGRVDMSANGVNDVTIKNVGKDIGSENYKDRMPYRPVNNDAFTVLRDSKEQYRRN